MYATGACEPGGPVLKSLLLHPIASMLLACTEYAHCGEMKKLSWIMEHRNAQKKQMGAKRNDDKCVSCSTSVSHSRIGKLSTTRGSCKLCFQAVCRSCRVRKLLTFMEPDLKYEKRKVTFCPVCIKDALSVSALQVARIRLWSRRSKESTAPVANSPSRLHLILIKRRRAWRCVNSSIGRTPAR